MILPETANVFGSQSVANSLWTGTEGYVQYKNDTTGQDQRFTVHWNNPYLGTNSCTPFIMGPLADLLHVSSFCGSGDEKAPMRFEISHSNRRYKIVSRATKLVLDVPNGSTNNKVKIQQYRDLGGANQYWRLAPFDVHHYMIFNENSLKVLDVADGTNQPGEFIQQYARNDGDNQLWRLRPTSSFAIAPLGGSPFLIQNKKSGLVLDVPNGDVAEKPIQQYQQHGGNNQQWYLVPVG